MQPFHDQALAEDCAEDSAAERRRARHRAAEQARRRQSSAGSRACSIPNLEKWLHRITVPTQVVWGREDRLLPSAYARLWGERVPGAEVSMIEACGHSPHVEQADPVADKVTRLSRPGARMKFVCFHLMPYRPLDLERGEELPLGLGGSAQQPLRSGRRAPPNTIPISTSSPMPSSSASTPSASTNIIRPPTG